MPLPVAPVAPESPADRALSVSLTLIESPVRSPEGRPYTVDWQAAPGERLASYLPEGVPLAKVVLNGRVIPEDQWATTIVGEEVRLVLLPQFGDAGTLIAIGISILISLAFTGLSLLLAPRPPELAGPDDPTFSFSGVRMTRGPGHVVAVPYGRIRVAPQVLSAEVSNVEAAFDGGPATIKKSIDQVTGGGPGQTVVLVIANHGFREGDQIRITGVGGKTKLNDRTWIIRPIGDANQFGLMQSIGIDGRAWTGGGQVELLTAPVVDASHRQVSRFNVLLALGEGPLAAIETATVLIDGQPVGNYPDVTMTTRLGTPHQTQIAGFGDTRLTVADGREITSDGIRYTTTAPIDAFTANVDFQEGLVHFTDSGRKQPNSSTFRFRYRRNPDGIADNGDEGPWSQWFTHTARGARTSTVHFAVGVGRTSSLARNTYDIEFEFLEADRTDDLLDRWKPFLAGVTQIQRGTQTYPNTALLALSFPATENIRGDLPEISVIVRGRTVRQVHAFASAPVWTQNPAPIVLDWMTNTRYGLGIPDSEINLPAFQAFASFCQRRVNGQPRHTLNTIMAEEVVDEASIGRLMSGVQAVMTHSAGLWAPRLTQNDAPVWLLNWSAVSNVRLGMVRDPARTTVIEAAYRNDDRDYEVDMLTYPVEPNQPAIVRKDVVQIPTITNAQEMQQMLAFLLRARRQPKLSLEFEATLGALELQAWDVFAFSHPHAQWGTSGRILAGSSASSLVLNEEVTFESNASYHVYVRDGATGTVDIRAVTNPYAGSPVTTDTIALQSGLSVTPQAETSLFAFGTASPDEAVRLFRVIKMDRARNARTHFTCLEHVPEVYATPPVVTLPPGQSPPTGRGVPPRLLRLEAQELDTLGGAVGRGQRLVYLDWTVEAQQLGQASYWGAIIERRTIAFNASLADMALGEMILGTEQDTTDVPEVTGFARLNVVTGGTQEYTDGTAEVGATYIYRVTPISQQGRTNPNGFETITLTVGGGGAAGRLPTVPQNLRLVGETGTTFNSPEVTLTWDDPASHSAPALSARMRYRIDVWGAGQAFLLRRFQQQAETSVTYTHLQNSRDSLAAGLPTAQRQLVFSVQAVFQGFVGPAATLAVSNPAPDMSALTPVLTPIVGGLIISWAGFAAPPDMDGFAVRLRQGTTVAPADEVIRLPRGTRSYLAVNLPNAIHAVQIVPFDTYGQGIASALATGTPKHPSEGQNFFVRNFILEDILFEPDPDTDTVHWNTGTLDFIDDQGVAQTRIIASGSATWPGSSVFIYYELGQGQFQATTDLASALGPNKAIMGVYNGGAAFTLVGGKATVDGADILANSIGANQLITDTAVITTSAQIANLVVDGATHLQDASVGNAQIGNAAIDTANIVDLAVERAKIALAAIGEAQIDDLAVKTAHIQDLAVDTLKIAGVAVTTDKLGNNAVSLETVASASSYTVLDPNNVEETILEFALNLVGTGRLLLFGKYVVNIPSGTTSLTTRLNDVTGGTTLDSAIHADVDAQITTSHLAIQPTNFTQQRTYRLTVLQDNGSSATLEQIKFLALYVKK